MMMTTEGDDNIVKSTGAEAIVEDYDNDGKDMMRQSLNFSNGAGRISAIDFMGGDKLRANNDVEISSFYDDCDDTEERKGERRSQFNEDLLRSTGEFELKQKKKAEGRAQKMKKPDSNPELSRDLEVSIDIEWPAQRIEQEYRKQQT